MSVHWRDAKEKQVGVFQNIRQTQPAIAGFVDEGRTMDQGI